MKRRRLLCCVRSVSCASRVGLVCPGLAWSALAFFGHLVSREVMWYHVTASVEIGLSFMFCLFCLHLCCLTMLSSIVSCPCPCSCSCSCRRYRDTEKEDPLSISLIPCSLTMDKRGQNRTRKDETRQDRTMNSTQGSTQSCRGLQYTR